MTSSTPRLIHGPWTLSSTEDLEHLNHASCVYSILQDLIHLGGTEHLHATEFTDLTQELEALVASKTIHPTDIKNSDLLLMLHDIGKQNTTWPSTIRRQARLLRATWEARFGRKFLGTPLYAPEDRLNSDHDEISCRVRLGHGYHSTVNTDQPKAHRLLNLQQPLTSPPRQQKPEIHHGGRLSADLPLRGLSRSQALHLAPTMRVAIGPRPPATALRTGSLSFKVGDWWPGPAAAARDCIIEFMPSDKRHCDIREGQRQEVTRDSVLQKVDEPTFPSVVGYSNGMESKASCFDAARYEAASITYDEFGAYAILLSGESEDPIGGLSATLFKAHPRDPGNHTLTKNARTRDAVRVLRTCYQTNDRTSNELMHGENIRPVAGVRFDGLHRVTKYSVKLEDGSIWCYKYNLERLVGQKCMDGVLNIPSRDMIADAFNEKTKYERKFGCNKEDEYWGFTDALMHDTEKSRSKLEERNYAKAQQEYASLAMEKIKQMSAK